VTTGAEGGGRKPDVGILSPREDRAGKGEPAPAGAELTVLHHADDCLIMSQRLSEWVSRGPDLETDIALANIALDHLGVARTLLERAADLEGQGRTEDDLAMMRSEREFTNLLLCEQPNGDFGQTIARLFCFDTYQLLLWEALAAAADPVLAGVAGKARMEAAYHLRFSSDWVVRLGAGTAESKLRMQGGLDTIWRFTGEMFERPPASGLETQWRSRVAKVLVEAGLDQPTDPYQRTGGREGMHTEHLGHLLAEMQWLARAHPGAGW
jgi:ring-1,2-phenylacetyl-CoA epoxidase subunit PaaC